LRRFLHDYFCKLPAADLRALTDVSIAAFGACEASPHSADKPSLSANAPAAMRAASLGFAAQLRQFDSDLERPLFGPDGETWGMVDCGDVPTDRADALGNRRHITDATRAILSAGAAPIILGGDDSVPVPWFAGSKAVTSIRYCRSMPIPTGPT
jgi:agmatinase